MQIQLMTNWWHFFLFFPEKKLWYFMQIASYGGDLHETSKLILWEYYKKKKKNIVNFSSAE